MCSNWAQQTRQPSQLAVCSSSRAHRLQAAQPLPQCRGRPLLLQTQPEFWGRSARWRSVRRKRRALRLDPSACAATGGDPDLPPDSASPASPSLLPRGARARPAADLLFEFLDPLHSSAPERAGDFSPEPGVSLYFELRGRPSSTEKVLLLAGAGATMRHNEQLASRIAASSGGDRFEVLTFDYRGIGRSALPASRALEPQSAEQLARDAFMLVAREWAGGGSRLHVVGTAMGGMVAQELALLFLRELRVGGGGDDGDRLVLARSARLAPPRLCSLTLNATARNFGAATRFLPLGARAYRRILPLFVKSDPEAMVASILSRSVPPSYLALPHPLLPGRTVGDLWRERWVREYDEWFSFRDMDATAAQATVAGKHHLTDAEADAISSSGIPVLVCYPESDDVVAPRAQRRLAELLGADEHAMPGGHLGYMADFRRFSLRVVAHMIQAAAT